MIVDYEGTAKFIEELRALALQYRDDIYHQDVVFMCDEAADRLEIFNDETQKPEGE